MTHEAVPGGPRWAATGLLPLAAMWGSSFLFIAVAVPAIGVFAISEARAALGALAVAVVLLVRRRRFRFGQSLRRYVLLGAFASAAPYLLMSYATEQQGAALTAIFFATAPLFSVLIEWLWSALRPRTVALAGLLLGLAGVAVIVATSTGGAGGDVAGAYAAALGAGFFSALGGSYANRHFTDEEPLTQSFGQSATAAALMIPVLVLARPHSVPTWPQAGAIVGLGVICTAVAYTLFFWLIGRLGPTRTLIVELMVPAFASLWGWLALSERMSPAILIGAAAILCGCAAVMSRPRAAHRSVAPDAGSRSFELSSPATINRSCK